MGKYHLEKDGKALCGSRVSVTDTSSPFADPYTFESLNRRDRCKRCEHLFNKDVTKPKKCSHCGKNQVMLFVPIAADLSHTGKSYRRYLPIDACIADIVSALNNRIGSCIETRANCCGHGKEPGSIILMDGRELKIFKPKGNRE